MRIVADALCLAHIAARHDVELVAIFSEPHRRGDLLPTLAERGESDIFLPPNRCWDLSGHVDILTPPPGLASSPPFTLRGWRVWFVARLGV